MYRFVSARDRLYKNRLLIRKYKNSFLPWNLHPKRAGKVHGISRRADTQEFPSFKLQKCSQLFSSSPVVISPAPPGIDVQFFISHCLCKYEKKISSGIKSPRHWLQKEINFPRHLRCLATLVLPTSNTSTWSIWLTKLHKQGFQASQKYLLKLTSHLVVKEHSLDFEVEFKIIIN